MNIIIAVNRRAPLRRVRRFVRRIHAGKGGRYASFIRAVHAQGFAQSRV